MKHEEIDWTNLSIFFSGAKWGGLFVLFQSSFTCDVNEKKNT